MHPSASGNTDTHRGSASVWHPVKSITPISLPPKGLYPPFQIPPTLPLSHSPSPGPSVVWMGPTGAGTGTGRGAVSDRNLRGWPGRGLGPGFLRGGWAKAGTQCRRRCPPGPSWWSPPASFWPPKTWHKSPNKVRCVEGGDHLYPRRGSPGRGTRYLTGPLLPLVPSSHWSPTLAHKHAWKDLEPNSPAVPQMPPC